jgi:hypothetical protein
MLAGVALAALAACSGSPPPALYTLVPRPGTPIGRPAPTVVLRTVEIAKYLDRPEIVRRRTDYELKVADTVRWAEGMADMVARVLAADLAQRLPASAITLAEGAVTAPAATTLALDVARFDPDPDGTVVLVARWAVGRGERAGAVQLTRIEVKPTSPATADLVAAMSDALAQLSDTMAQALAAPG